MHTPHAKLSDPAFSLDTDFAPCDLGYDLIWTEVTVENGRKIVRLYIDRLEANAAMGHVGIEDCVRATRELNVHVVTLADVSDRQTLWLIWPKKASGVKSDLVGNVVRETGLAAGWVDFKVCSVDDTWSGLAFKRKK